ncbi:permease-like cell division protein FtsX [Alkaliphilus serpentinus]|uniref:Cell division protein FtsX n=1 Tax=Alkaliphilus serpentinus TaxID=1482731 RepID=A0A833MAX6_9FIRM|nr:permease-like cell division protein FtsX [Alkaliphilus serpentinus]KAB3533544.1 ABC transporter permease [Alkaliphilus serpentinus]
MKIRTLKYMMKQGFVGLWRNKNMSLASITSVAASLVVLGLIIILVLNINNIASLTQLQFDTVQVYVQEELTEEEISLLGSNIEAIKGVETALYESKEQAMLNMKERWGEQGYLLETLEENPLPNSYVINLEGIDYADGVVSNLKNLEGVDEVKYYKEIIENLLKIAGFIRTVGLALIGILILVAMFIISNTVKLALNARRQEINIMKYVGATNWFIRWPFIVEGVILGLLGAMIALVVVRYGYGYTFDAINNKFTVVFSAYLLPLDILMGRTMMMFAVIGAGVGALGSIVSLRKHLRV